jgi:hypothetical protein
MHSQFEFDFEAEKLASISLPLSLGHRDQNPQISKLNGN